MAKTMQAVKDLAGEFLQTAKHDKIPQSFLAALTGNESYPPGNIDSRRHEPAVLAKLVAVLLGQSKSYKGVTAGMLLLDVNTTDTSTGYAIRMVRRLQDAATSWGFTQIMGYHMLRWGKEICDLTDPAKHYGFTLRMLSECPEDCKVKFGVEVDLSKDFEKMARWWNTGKPDGKTYHESYVPNIKRRMTEWAQMVAGN